MAREQAIRRWIQGSLEGVGMVGHPECRLDHLTGRSSQLPCHSHTSFVPEQTDLHWAWRRIGSCDFMEVGIRSAGDKGATRAPGVMPC